ncbi:hypothetical protein LWI29_019163 [Acer saccharum]|uniref:DUF1985 domain-containing protein n=1 Tax=Acer saccharum TaxID=4024 RepID=A0AA39RW14_ACESA|nr:hypothetical protein LWI29_019163 [Acer saccharum]
MDRVGMLRRWEHGVFRQFLKMDREFFSGKLCHILLCRELNYPSARPDEMWFRVGERAVRFGKEEFFLVTGLRFGPMPVSVHSLPKAAVGSVHHRYFGGSPTPLKDILGRLNRGEFDEAEDVIKLGYVYFLSHVMLGREYRWKVPDWIWGLVEDITAFEAFPWGTYIYSVTIYWLGTALDDRTKGRKQNRNYSSRQDLGYCLYGFPWALMYWAMEAIPVLSGSVGKRRRGRNGHGFPRLTRWNCRKKPPQLEHKFTDELEAYTTLTPTAEERLQEYYRQFDPLAVVGPELHMHGGYDPENEAGHRETRSKEGYDNDLRSYIESRFKQIDLKIDKLLADRVHVPVPPVPVAPVPPVPVTPVPPVPVAPVPPVPVAPQPTSQPTWSAGYTPTWSAGYTRSVEESSMRRYDMEEIGEQQVMEETVV